MKILYLLVFLLQLFSIKLLGQTDPCTDQKPLKINIYDRFGFEKITNFCQGEEVTFKVEGDFDRYIWGVNNSNSDLNRAYSYEPNLKIKLPNNQIHITISTFKKGDECYSNGSKLINNFITTERRLIIADSAFVGEEIVISTNYHIPDDILFTPFDTVFNFSGFRKINFQAIHQGRYKLVNERINNSCGNHDLEKSLYLTENNAPTLIELSGPANLNHCDGWLMEIGLKPTNLKIKNPEYIVYLSGSPTIIKDSYYEQLATISTEKGLILKPNYNLAGNYLFVREQLSGVYSNVIGPFKSVEKTTATNANLEIIQYPQTIIGNGDSTSYQIKTDLNTKVYWMNNSNIINEQTTNFKIKAAGYYWPVFTYEGECVRFDSKYKAVYVSDFENLTPKLSILKSCEKKNYLKLDLGVGQWNDANINTKLKIRWLKDGKLDEENDHLEFATDELGKYSCEILYKNQIIESNILQVNDFNRNLAKVYVNGYPNIYNVCSMADLITKTFTNAYSYSINNVQIKNTDTLYNFSWFIDNELQSNHSTQLIPPTNKNQFSLKLMVNDGECNYFSYPQLIKTKEITLSFFEPKYEFCEGSVAEIYAPIDENVYTGNGTALYNWYKDGRLFQSKKADFNSGHMDINLKATESGVYNLTTIFLADSCTIKREPFEIVFKKNITIKSDQYLKRLCPTDPLLELKLPRTDFEKIEWYHNNSLVTDQPLNYSYLQLNTPGQYFAKITYPNECTATSEILDFDGTNDFEIIKSTTNDFFCKDDYLQPGKFYETSQIPFEFTWLMDSTYVSSNYQFKPTKSGTYRVIAKHTEGNCTLISKPLKVKLPNLNFSLSEKDSASFCANNMLKLSLIDSTSQILGWFTNGKSLTTNKILEVKKEGNYQALFNQAQCPADYYFSNSLKVSELAKATASISGSANIEYGKATDLKIDLTSNPPWQVKLNTGEEFTIQKSPHLLTVRPLTDVTFSIETVKNICGMGTSTGAATVKILVLADELNEAPMADFKVFPIPVADEFELEIANSNEATCELNILNNLGQIVQRENLFSNQDIFHKKLNISNLPNGIYHIQIKLGAKTLYKKIVKQ